MNYFLSLLFHLKSQGLLTEKVETSIILHHEEFNNIESNLMPYGKYKGRTIRDIYTFDHSYIGNLINSRRFKKKYKKIYEECIFLISW